MNKIKYYADCPDGKKNKLFSYPCHDLSHCIDILNRAVAKGLKLRSAWYHDTNGNQKNLKAILTQIDGDLSATYKALNTLESKF